MLVPTGSLNDQGGALVPAVVEAFNAMFKRDRSRRSMKARLGHLLVETGCA